MILRSMSLLAGAACAALATAACSGVRAPATLPPQLETSQRMMAAGRPNEDLLAAAAPIGAVGARDAGPAAARAMLQIAVTLKYRDKTGLDRLVERQRVGAASWLTNAEFNARFAPSKQTYDAVIRSLRSAGFRAVATYPNRTVVDLRGSVGDAERYFNTSIHNVIQDGASRLANVTVARAPSALRGSVLAVSGLSTLILVHTLTKNPGFPYYGPISSYTGRRGYGPASFLAAYDYPSRHGAFTGSGRTAGIVIDADFRDSDLATFLKYFGIPRPASNTVRVPIDKGPPPAGTTEDSLEATLDIDTLASLAPRAKVYMYQMPSLTTANITDAYAKIVSDNVADVVNSSFGGLELLLGTAPQAWDALFEQGLAKGITFSASTGDAGGYNSQNAPASSPYVAAVGGTELGINSKGAWQEESAWAGGGGGYSLLEPLPSWQNGIANVDAAGRNVPDVALDADAATGVAFYINGTWDSNADPLGGTSLASPLYVAGVTQMEQVKNERLGLSSGGIFAAFAHAGYGSQTAPIFHDIVQGNNGVYFAQPGYDQATGIGSPDFWNLVQSLP